MGEFLKPRYSSNAKLGRASSDRRGNNVPQTGLEPLGAGGLVNWAPSGDNPVLQVQLQRAPVKLLQFHSSVKVENTVRMLAVHQLKALITKLIDAF